MPEQDTLNKIPIEVLVSVGRATPSVNDLINLGPDSVLPLGRHIDDPVEIFVGDRLIALGELLELDGDKAGQLAVRLIETRDISKGV